MSKKDKIKNIDMDDLKALPDVLDGRHHVIPIVTGGDEVLEEVNVPEILPILTLRSSVLFPGAITPITVGREKSIRLVREVNERNGLLGAVLQRESEVEDPAPDDMYKVGTAARIIKILEMPNGNLTVILNGLEKIEVKEYVSTEPYFQASVTPLRDSSPDVKSLEFEALVDSIRDIALGIIAISPDMPKEAAFAIKNIDSKRGIINFICSNLELSDEDRQSLLESPGLLARARKLLEILVREQQLVELKNEIQSRVKQEIDKQQRDYYLQQQMRTIQDELGEGADSELEGLREKASKKNWPKEVGETFEKELQKVERLNPAVAEYSVQVTYLQLMLELPWNDVTQDNLDLKCAREQLDHDHFGLDEVKERLLEHLAVIKLKGDLKSPILCLYGPPGVGKTSLGKSVAAALGRKFGRISLGGLHDEAEIRGHRRTYIGAMPGRIIQTIKRCGSSNPVIILDEVDKVTVSNHGDPSSALLEVLDSEQNYAFRDHYLEIPVDLSRVMFIMTANTLDTIPRPLLDRMEIIEIPSYTDEEKVQIAQRHLLPKERQAHGLTASSLRVDESAIRAAIALYTRESGVRSLERQLGKICRKAAMQLATSDVKRVTVTEKNIKDFLGAPRAAQEKIPEKDLVGVVNGLAWNEVGGEILPVEVGVMDGSGKVELTGNLGDVMQESCRAALSCLRQRAQELGIAPDFYKTRDIHIHFPEGAIPKDGPSAGIAIATAVLSALTGQAVHRDVAMTGEITLRGRVLAIGGLREKTMGALRAGVHTVILPKENEKDLDEIDPLVREKLRFVPVETVDAVFAEALVLPEKCTAAAHESYLPPVQESAHSALRAGEMS